MLQITSGRLALAVSSLSLVVAMGGVGYAATQIGTNGIKNNAVTSAKIKNNNVTGQDVKESSLGQVPSAAKAGSATSAGAVDGFSAAKIVFRSSATTPTVVFNQGGLVVSASCSGGNLQLTAATSKENSSIYSILIDDEADTVNGNDSESQSFDVGDTYDLLDGVGPSATDPAVVTFVYDSTDGTVATGILSTDLSCAVTGTVTVG